MTRRSVGVLLSGRGSNLQALIDACAHPHFPASIDLVISNVPGAQGLMRAELAGIPTATVDHRSFASRMDFDAAIDRALANAGIDLLCNAGFLRLHTAEFVARWRDRHLNIHPSLLPAYKGLHTHERVLADGVRITGCTVHFVRDEMDTGPVIAQAAVAVMQDDSPESLGARVLQAEHRLYPYALELVAGGKIHVEGERVVGNTPKLAQPPLFSPPLD